MKKILFAYTCMAFKLEDHNRQYLLTEEEYGEAIRLNIKANKLRAENRTTEEWQQIGHKLSEALLNQDSKDIDLWKKRKSEFSSSARWWTNDIIETFAINCPEGFHPGRLRFPEEINNHRKSKISETLKNKHVNCKSVICISLNISYFSIKEAAKAQSINRGTLVNCIKTNKPDKNGNYWKWGDE